MVEEQTSQRSKRMSRDHHSLLLCDITARVLHSNDPSTHHSEHMSLDR
jgi:hypothetical protein